VQTARESVPVVIVEYRLQQTESDRCGIGHRDLKEPVASYSPKVSLSLCNSRTMESSLSRRRMRSQFRKRRRESRWLMAAPNSFRPPWLFSGRNAVSPDWCIIPHRPMSRPPWAKVPGVNASRWEIVARRLQSLASSLHHELGWGLRQFAASVANRFVTTSLRSNLQLLYCEAARALKRKQKR
jgi:hypothetical protein